MVFHGCGVDVQPAGGAHRGLPTTPDAGACDFMLHAGACALGVSTGAADWLSGRWDGERLVTCRAGYETYGLGELDPALTERPPKHSPPLWGK
jgi:hypothetical protein